MVMTLGLSGCSGAVSSATGAVPSILPYEIISVVTTDKTIEDHAVSIYSGKNCSTVRTERGLTYCEEDQKVDIPQVYCYRTLADRTCYAQPDPFGQKQQAVGRESF